MSARIDYLLAVLTTAPTECTTWPFNRNKKGYGIVYDPDIKRSQFVHQVVVRWRDGPPPAGHQVRHLCLRGHEGCFTPAHLAYGTYAQNAADGKRPPRRTTADSVEAVLTRAGLSPVSPGSPQDIVGDEDRNER